MDDGDFYGANCTAAVNLSGTVVGNVQSPSLYSAHSHRSLRTVTEKVYSMRSHVVAAARLGSYASAWTTPIPLGAPNATPGTVLADRRWFVEKVFHLVLSAADLLANSGIYVSAGTVGLGLWLLRDSDGRPLLRTVL